MQQIWSGLPKIDARGNGDRLTVTRDEVEDEVG